MMKSALLLLLLAACSTTSKKDVEMAKKDEISHAFPKDNPAGESTVSSGNPQGKPSITR